MVNKPKRIALIDADGILYAAALAGETSCDGTQLQLLDVEYVYKDCLARIEKLVGEVEADDAFIILSDRRNFRYDIFPEYKANRKGGPRPLMLDDLRAMIVEEAPYKTWLIEGLEADDVCGIAAGTLMAAGRETVICSPDKDLLQIPGLVYGPRLNTKTGGKLQVVRVTEEEGDDFHMKQTLMGDTVDGYKGCPGIGPVKARKLLEQWKAEGLTAGERWKEIVKLYEASGLTEGEALVQARVSRILRVSDWDPAKKEPILWQPPTTQ
jgi:DNA polymerase-1